MGSKHFLIRFSIFLFPSSQGPKHHQQMKGRLGAPVSSKEDRALALELELTFEFWFWHTLAMECDPVLAFLSSERWGSWGLEGKLGMHYYLRFIEDQTGLQRFAHSHTVRAELTEAHKPFRLCPGLSRSPPLFRHAAALKWCSFSLNFQVQTPSFKES